MVSLFGALSRIRKQNILVIGDLVLDTYTIGKARRISPEAPVAVLNVSHEEHRPGMAGNVALNLLSLMGGAAILGRVGRDSYGEILIAALKGAGADVSGILAHEDYSTPVKNRIIADNQQIVRVDREQIRPIPEQIEKRLIASLPELFEGVKLIAVSDYGKGFITKPFMQAIIHQAKNKRIPVIVDPKGTDYDKYRGADIVKPNLSELYAAAGLPLETPIDLAAAKVLESTDSKILMVTRSEAGISLFYKDGKREDFPVRVREVKDVTGAGDTVLAMLACSIANELSPAEGAHLSNVAAGIAIERFGCAQIELSELAARLISEDVHNKVFDDEHLFAFSAALKDCPYSIVSVSEADGFTVELVLALRELAKKKGKGNLLIYVPEAHPQSAFVDALASLQEVDYLILKNDSINDLLKIHPPQESYICEGGKMRIWIERQVLRPLGEL